MSDSAPTPFGRFRALAGWILLPLIAGILLSLLIPKPTIGVIYLKDAIYDGSAQDMITQLIYAREHPEVRAVVLVVNSPGGTVTDTESVYLEMARLRQTKPVVMMVEGMAASGAYYLAAGSDYVLAKPSSLVGNIGIIGYLPESPNVQEEVYSTGPYKTLGYPRDTFIRDMDTLKQGFLKAVQIGRGDRLKIGPEVILRGEIWTGTTALKYGLIDAIGTQSQAFDQAAAMAHIAHYTTADLRTLSGLPIFVTSPFYYQAPDGRITPYPNQSGLFYLYVPPTEEQP